MVSKGALENISICIFQKLLRKRLQRGLHLIDVGVRVIYQSREILHIPEDLLSVFCTISQNSWESHLSLTKYQPISNQVSVSVYQYLSCLQENVSYHCLCLCPLVLLINIKTRHYIKFNKQQKSE